MPLLETITEHDLSVLTDFIEVSKSISQRGVTQPNILLESHLLPIMRYLYCTPLEQVLDLVQPLPKLRCTLAIGGKNVYL